MTRRRRPSPEERTAVDLRIIAERNLGCKISYAFCLRIVNESGIDVYASTPVLERAYNLFHDHEAAFRALAASLNDPNATHERQSK